MNKETDLPHFNTFCDIKNNKKKWTCGIYYEDS